MEQFFCYGKNDFCKEEVCGESCDFFDGSGGEMRKVETLPIENKIGEGCDCDRMREPTEADRDGRRVVQPCKTGGQDMKRYAKKPVTVEAIQWTGKNLEELKGFVGDNLEYDILDAAWEVGKGAPAINVRIKTLEGVHHASVGDFIIKGVHGEFYPCKPDIFRETYDEADTEKGGSDGI